MAWNRVGEYIIRECRTRTVCLHVPASIYGHTCTFVVVRLEQDFSGVIAKEVSFKGSDLRGSRFFKADLQLADFTGANLGTASLEEADLNG